MPKFDDQGRWKEPTDQEAWSSGKRAVIVLIVVALLMPVAVFGIRWVTAPARGAASAREKIQANGDFRIAAYNQFFDLCSAVQAQEDRIAIFEQSSGPNAQANLDAVRANRAALIRDYNSKASRSYTEGQFRDSDLPYQINVNEESTTCKAS